jgi:hypothetical protein
LAGSWLRRHKTRRRFGTARKRRPTSTRVEPRDACAGGAKDVVLGKNRRGPPPTHGSLRRVNLHLAQITFGSSWPLSPRSIARHETGVLPNAFWSAADAVSDRADSARFDAVAVWSRRRGPSAVWSRRRGPSAVWSRRRGPSNLGSPPEASADQFFGWSFWVSPPAASVAGVAPGVVAPSVPVAGVAPGAAPPSVPGAGVAGAGAVAVMMRV